MIDDIVDSMPTELDPLVGVVMTRVKLIQRSPEEDRPRLFAKLKEDMEKHPRSETALLYLSQALEHIIIESSAEGIDIPE